MEKNVAEIISEKTGLRIYNDYSGRGMYGRKTHGIIVNSLSEFYESLGEIMMYASEEERIEVGEYLSSGNISSDSLGLEMIIY